MLSDADRDLYHVAGDPQLAEALMTPKEATRATVVAREVRKAIIAGEYDGNGRAPSRADLKEKFGVSLENASVVLRMLAAEGWVTLEQGRGSFLRPRNLYRVWVEVPPAAGERLRDSDVLRQSVEVAARDEPAVDRVERAQVDRPQPDAGDDEDLSARVALAVTATTPAMAAEIAENLVRSAPGWSWDGWDLAGASVTARPA